MTAPADLAEVSAALALVAQATQGPWSSTPAPTSPAGGLLVFDVASGGRPIATTCGDTDETIEEAERNAAAIVALRNAAPAITAAVEELERLRAETARQRETIRAGADAVRSANASTTEIGCRLDDAGERIAALERQVCRLVSGQEIDGDRLCQHHGADVAALALLSDERAAHAETSRDLDALLTALGAQVTPGGQTEEACHARRVADGLRLAKRAAKSAPAKCSCTHEAGDSWCLAHPTCAECGAFTPSCVDACADHVKPAPAVPARREVPADVEAAIVSLVAAARDATNYEPDRTTVAKHLTAERLVKEAIADIRAAIAKAIADAEERARADGPSATHDVDAAISDLVEASRDLEVYAAGKATPARTRSAERSFGRASHAVFRAIAAEIERARAEGRAESRWASLGPVLLAAADRIRPTTQEPRP